jgi:hypothetical protein
MIDMPIAGPGLEGQLLQRVVAQYGAPAYIRRAQQVQDALDRLMDRCRKQRDEWLPLVRLRLGLLKSLSADWDQLASWLAGQGQIEVLAHLHETLAPRLRVRVEPNTAPRVLRRALAELVESINRFNRRWVEYMDQLDLGEVNRLREGYNRYYLLEKECAVRSVRVAMQDFARLAPLTKADVAEMFPLLPVPQLR